MGKVIITTVGTSLLNNLIRKENIKNFGFKMSEDDAEDIANGLLEEEFFELPEYCKTLILANDHNLRKVLFDKNYQLNLNASAEIKSICRIAAGGSATVYLLATDTFMSEYAAEQTRKHLHRKHGLNVINEGRVSKLKIDNPKEFEQSGFEKLIKKLEEIREKHKRDSVVLNISGGYKALIPFLTIYAQVNKLPIKYIYENSDEVITIGKTPLDFDWEPIEQNYFALEKFGDNGDKSTRLVDFKERLAINENDQDDLFQELSEKGIIVEVESDKVKLTNLGQFYLQTYNEKFHSSTFHRKSLHSKLIEYMVFENYQSEYPGETVLGYTPPGTDYDIDVYIETNEKVIAIEVKPAGNIPDRKRGKKSDHDTIEYKVEEGSFRHLINTKGKSKDLEFRYVCYGPNGVHSSPQKKIRDILSETLEIESSKEIVFKLCHLKTPINFKSNTNWKIDSNHSINPIFSVVLNEKTENDV